jgi:hypothetical protein
MIGVTLDGIWYRRKSKTVVIGHLRTKTPSFCLYPKPRAAECDP